MPATATQTAADVYPFRADPVLRGWKHSYSGKSNDEIFAEVEAACARTFRPSVAERQRRAAVYAKHMHSVAIGAVRHLRLRRDAGLLSAPAFACRAVGIEPVTAELVAKAHAGARKSRAAARQSAPAFRGAA